MLGPVLVDVVRHPSFVERQSARSIVKLLLRPFW
jgi:hypothetical protein